MTKKYKLIKEYPGSPKLGCTPNFVFSHYEYGSYRFTPELVEKNPEFWQEIIEKKDYEILSYHKKDSRFITTDNIDNCCTIHSVKRLSDGEIFTIGDKYTYPNMGKTVILGRVIPRNEDYNIIEKFEIFEDKLYLNSYPKYNDGTKGTELWRICHINSATHFTPKVPLLITEDNVEIFSKTEQLFDVYCNPNDTSLFRVIESKTPVSSILSFSPGTLKYRKFFFSRERAEEYVYYNKPLVNINEVLSLKKVAFIYWEDKLKELVKSKL